METILTSTYQNKFKLLILITALDLIAKHKDDFVSSFRLDLFNETQLNLQKQIIKQVNEAVRNFKHLNISRLGSY